MKVRWPSTPALVLTEPTKLIVFRNLRIVGFAAMIFLLLAAATLIMASVVTSNITAETFMGPWVAKLPVGYELRSDDPVTLLAKELNAHVQALLWTVELAALALFGSVIVIKTLVDFFAELFIWRCLMPRSEVAFAYLRYTNTQHRRFYLRSLAWGAVLFVGVGSLALVLRAALEESTIATTLSILLVGVVALGTGFEYRLLARSGIFDTQASARDVMRVLLARAADLLILLVGAAGIVLLLRDVAIPGVTDLIESTSSDIKISSVKFSRDAAGMQLPEEAIEAILRDVRLRTLVLENLAATWSADLGGLLDRLLPALVVSALVVVTGGIGLPLARQRMKHRVNAIAVTAMLLVFGVQVLLRLGVSASYGATDWNLWEDFVRSVIGFSLGAASFGLAQIFFGKDIQMRHCWGCGRRVSDTAEVCEASAHPLAAGKTTFPKFVGHTQTKRLHRPECRFVRRVKGRRLVAFSDANEGFVEGYRECAQCLAS